MDGQGKGYATSIMEIKKESPPVDCDLTFTSFYSILEVFKDRFDFLPKILRVSLIYLDTAKALMHNLLPQDYKDIKDKIDLGFELHLDENYPAFYWQVEGIKDNIKHIIYSNGA